ncbi:hypothetical protein [Streptomyces sp. NPDC002573]|uniref:hypothetical protein n=1 Tax=Streptomyces sp. NPDC002573 TaxID=3364651 RepID=UPI0036B81B82
MMRTLPHPNTGEGAVVLGVFLLIGLELVALATAPRADRPVVGGALVVAATAAFVLVAAVLHGHGKTRRQATHRPAEAANETWFTAETLQGFPMEAVRPRLLGPHAPDLTSMYTAWIFAAQGRDAVWLEHHLDLPADLAHLLVDAAHERH